MKTLKVHPAADLFPMLPEEELADLADDIKTNGLQHPIVLDNMGVLIDGRNRLAACKLAGVDPLFETMSGDALQYIHSTNIKRRHLSKGQQAMLTAMLFPEPEKGGRGKKAENSKESLGFSVMRLSQARAVLQHSEALAKDIIQGIARFDDAVDQVRRQQKANESAEQALDRQRKEYAKALVALRKSDPDLADQVDDESLKLDEALAAKEVRDKRNQVYIEAGLSAAVELRSDVMAKVDSMERAAKLGAAVVIAGDDRGALEQLFKDIRRFFE
jgi:ParB-like chromosome segregation protein Spo0J